MTGGHSILDDISRKVRKGSFDLIVLDNVNKCMFKFMTMAASELFHPACLRVREVLVQLLL